MDSDKRLIRRTDMANDQITLETTRRDSLDTRLQALGDADLAMIRGRDKPVATFDNSFDNVSDNTL